MPYTSNIYLEQRTWSPQRCWPGESSPKKVWFPQKLPTTPQAFPNQAMHNDCAGASSPNARTQAGPGLAAAVRARACVCTPHAGPNSPGPAWAWALGSSGAARLHPSAGQGVGRGILSISLAVSGFWPRAMVGRVAVIETLGAVFMHREDSSSLSVGGRWSSS